MENTTNVKADEGMSVQQILDRLREHVDPTLGHTMWIKNLILDIEIDCRRKGVPFS